jgi:hypothetical protein
MTLIKVQVKAAREVLDFARNDDNDFDLNRIVPAPDNISISSHEQDTFSPDFWNGWHRQNWGVTYDLQDVKRTSPQFVSFTAVEQMPVKALVALSEAFPGEKIRVTWKMPGSPQRRRVLKGGKELDERNHDIVYGLLDVATLKVGDKVKRSVVGNRTYHSEVTYVANDLKEVHFTGVAFKEADGSLVEEFSAGGRVEEYTAIEIDGSVIMDVNQKISRWQPDE